MEYCVVYGTDLEFITDISVYATGNKELQEDIIEKLEIGDLFYFERDNVILKIVKRLFYGPEDIWYFFGEKYEIDVDKNTLKWSKWDKCSSRLKNAIRPCLYDMGVEFISFPTREDAIKISLISLRSTKNCGIKTIEEFVRLRGF